MQERVSGSVRGAALDHELGTLAETVTVTGVGAELHAQSAERS